jgi:hypothetical protein
MTLSIALAISLAASSPISPELCGGVENKIEHDMRILESDLTRADAIAAAEQLRAVIERADVVAETQMGVLNWSKVIYGHLLLRQAQVDQREFGLDSAEATDSVETLCSWLGSQGFWHD